MQTLCLICAFLIIHIIRLNYDQKIGLDDDVADYVFSQAEAEDVY